MIQPGLITQEKLLRRTPGVVVAAWWTSLYVLVCKNLESIYSPSTDHLKSRLLRQQAPRPSRQPLTQRELVSLGRQG